MVATKKTLSLKKQILCNMMVLMEILGVFWFLTVFLFGLLPFFTWETK